MKRNIFFVGSIIILVATALFAYRQETALQRQGAAAIASIDLAIFTQRGAVLQTAVATSAKIVQQRLVVLDQGFDAQPVKTLAAYRQLLQEDPGYLPLRLRMGMLALKLGQDELARQHLHFVYEQKQAALQPDAAWFLGLLYAKEGAEKRARRFIEESVQEGSFYKKQGRAMS